MTRFISVLALMVVSFAIGVWTFVEGWGLTPHNWYVIVGGFILGIIVTGLQVACAKLFN